MNMDTEIVSWRGGGIERSRLPFISEASEGRSDELGWNYLSWDTWKKLWWKNIYFSQSYSPWKLGERPKSIDFGWFWCIFTKGIIRENPLPQLRPPDFRVGESEFFVFFWSKVSISILSFMHQEGCQSSQKRTAGGNVQYPPPRPVFQYPCAYVHNLI